MSLVVDIGAVILLAGLTVIAASCVLMATYAAWCQVVAPAIGRTAGAIDRRLHPVTEKEYRAITDERAARDSLRPHGSVGEVSTIYIPLGLNGHREYEDDPTT